MGILLSQDLPSERELDAYSTVVASVAERLAPSVASLRVTQRRGHRGLELAGGGSAVVITGDGYLLTDGRTFSFDVVGTDPLSDLAVLRVGSDDRHPAELGDADRLRVGQPAARPPPQRLKGRREYPRLPFERRSRPPPPPGSAGSSR
jgi:S1-C subfamily serine protease